MNGKRIPRNIICLLAVTALISVSGCGANEVAGNKQMDIVQEPENEPTEISKNADGRTTVTDNSRTEGIPETGEDNVEESDVPEEESAVKVYGNGSYFVKVGEKVFFHDYIRPENAEPSQGGQFLYLGNGIRSYDENTGESSVLYDAPCSGKLYYIGNEFYSTYENEIGQTQIVRVSMDGEQFMVGPGSVEGISDDGNLIALWCNDAAGSHLDVIDDSGIQYCRLDISDVGALSFCGLTDKEMIYQKEESDAINLYSMCEDNRETYLGTLSGLGIYGSPECDDFLYDKESGDIYCVLALYGGPVDSVEDYLVVKASPGKENSLELITHGYSQELMPNISYNDEPYLRLKNGKLAYGFFDDNELYLSHSYMGSHMLSRFVYGNLLWSDSDGETRTVVKNFIPYMDRDHLVMQTGEIMGDEAYVMVAEVKRNVDSDYKLSQAFDFESMYVMRIPIQENPDIEVIYGGDYKDSIAFNTEGFEHYVGTWRMDDFIVEDDQESGHSRNMWIGISDEQELSFIDNEEYSGFPFVLSTSDIGEECLIVGYNEVMGLTCTGRLSEAEGGERLILEVQERNESIDDPSPASWKGSFHRVTDEEMAVEWGSN